MAWIKKILRTSVYIIDEDNDFVRVLKQVFARGIENHRILSYTTADDMLFDIKQQQGKKIQRNIVIITASAHAKETNSIFETIELIKQQLLKSHFIVTYYPGEIEKQELDSYKSELMIDEIITKNNFARLRIQNAIRRFLSRDDFELRRKLLYISGFTAAFFTLTTILLYFFSGSIVQ